MSDINIEKGIPLLPRPVNRNPQRKPSKWLGFEVGDSAFFDGGDTNKLSSMSNSWGRYQTPRRKFACRSTERDGVIGVRVWRIE